ncbi:hypothetical protein, partial [Stenotrophomonas pavanii]|uniref:hypothetical protein n=1 Tax=Stenotrophomonas pavanii TaxID=487698 RepID=UPI0039C711C7
VGFQFELVNGISPKCMDFEKFTGAVSRLDPKALSVRRQMFSRYVVISPRSAAATGSMRSQALLIQGS